MTIDKEKLQALAWFTEDHMTDKSATTYDPVVACRWYEKGWPVHLMYGKEAVNALLAEIGQLKAENEALRKSIAGKVVCDLELFEYLRDSAAAEADGHRQSMGSYRPQRQEVLDHTVSRCDLLIAAAKEASNG